MKPSAPSSSELLAVRDLLRNAVGPVSRDAICTRTGLSDRVIREIVAELVKQGEPICSDRGSGGYEYSRDVRKLEREYQRLQSHATHIYARARALLQHLNEQRQLFQ